MAQANRLNRLPAQVVSIADGGHRERMLARRDELVEQNLSLVRSIARRLEPCLPPCFDFDELVSAGNHALWRAALRYKPAEHGDAPFSAYARKVIRGAMLDAVRGRSYTESTHAELAEADRCAEVPAIETVIDSGRLRRRISAAIELLPERQRRLLAEYYGPGEPSLAAVGEQLRISPTRANQLHAEAIDRLRRLLRAV
jgi:RNA polymerase sigma factor (sigma-70 family)